MISKLKDVQKGNTAGKKVSVHTIQLEGKIKGT